jgi:uncharacterized protein (DUF697 family)/GTP-binding protein EngB required for normal cell division
MSSTVTSGPFDAGKAAAEWEKEARKLGRFNLAVFGKTGVGKSTLVNAIFGDDVARTGIGAPVTQDSHLYLTRAGSLGLYDTKGLEIGTSSGQLLAEVRAFIESKRGRDASEHIHIAYYCIRAGDHRIEPAEKQFIAGLHELGLPVFLVLTQVHRKNGVYRAEHVQFADHLAGLGLPVHSGRPYLTAALPDQQLGYEAFGLEDLLTATYDKAPESVQAALAAAQVIDRSLKRKAAKVRIAAAATASAGVGATPIPFSDAALLVPLQMGMMAAIAQIYRIPMNSALATSLAATALATNLGRSTVTSLMKMLPGVNFVAMGVSAAVASAFTTAMGGAWMKVCEMMADGRFGPVESMDNEQIKSEFSSAFKQSFSEAVDRIGKRAKHDG